MKRKLRILRKVFRIAGDDRTAVLIDLVGALLALGELLDDSEGVGQEEVRGVNQHGPVVFRINLEASYDRLGE